jgi:hypothetical protein
MGISNLTPGACCRTASMSLFQQINTAVAIPPPPIRPIEMSDVAAVKQELLIEFANVFDKKGPLKTTSGPLMSIELLPGAVIFAVSGTRPISYPQRGKVKGPSG